MSKTNKTEHNKKAMLEALQKSLGIVSKACDVVGISRTQFYQWCKDDEAYQSDVAEIGERAIDFVESKLFSNIDSKKETSIIFFLKTKGRSRGYTEVQRFEGDAEKPFTIIHLGGGKDEEK